MPVCTHSDCQVPQITLIDDIIPGDNYLYFFRFTFKPKKTPLCSFVGIISEEQNASVNFLVMEKNPCPCCHFFLGVALGEMPINLEFLTAPFFFFFLIMQIKLSSF